MCEEISRRLDGDKDEKDDEKVKGPDSAYLVVEWTTKQWKAALQSTAPAAPGVC